MKLRFLAPIGLLVFATGAAADVVVYDLDAKNAKEIAEAVRSSLEAQCLQANVTAVACRANLLPTGQLLVSAPPAAQAQIAAVLKAIAARSAPPTPRVTLQYWLLYGEPRKPDAEDPRLEPLDTVLQQLERVHGSLGFSVRDATSITTQSGTSAESFGGGLQIDQEVRVNGDSADLEIELSTPAQQPDGLPLGLSVDVTIRRGEYLVLGEHAVGASDSSGRLFFVVHWPQGQ